MNFLPYDNFDQNEFILRDWLALDRTILATERTFLAYGRTSLALLATGMTLLKLFDGITFKVAGYVVITGGIVVFFYGLFRFVKMMRHFKALSILEKEEMLIENMIHQSQATLAEMQSEAAAPSPAPEKKTSPAAAKKKVTRKTSTGKKKA